MLFRDERKFIIIGGALQRIGLGECEDQGLSLFLALAYNGAEALAYLLES